MSLLRAAASGAAAAAAAAAEGEGGSSDAGGTRGGGGGDSSEVAARAGSPSRRHPVYVFLSASKLAQEWERVPPALLRSRRCLFFFGSKRGWLLFDEPGVSAELRAEAEAQPGGYTQMDPRFRALVRDRCKAGLCHFLKRDDLPYRRYPGDPDPDAYARASAWFATAPVDDAVDGPLQDDDDGGGVDADDAADGGGEAAGAGADADAGSVGDGGGSGSGEGEGEKPAVAPFRLRPFELDPAVWIRRGPHLRFAPGRAVARNIENGFHEYGEIQEMVDSSNPGLAIPVLQWPPRGYNGEFDDE